MGLLGLVSAAMIARVHVDARQLPALLVVGNRARHRESPPPGQTADGERKGVLNAGDYGSDRRFTSSCGGSGTKDPTTFGSILGITGAIYSTGAIAVLAFGLYWKRASSTGAALALLCGFSAILGLSKVRAALHYEAIGKLDWHPIDRPRRRGCAASRCAFWAMIVGSLIWPDREVT